MVHITDEPMVDPCSFIADDNAGEVTLVFQRQALLSDPEGTVRAVQRHWQVLADRYREVSEEAHRSAG